MKVRFGAKIDGWKNFTETQIKVSGVQHRRAAALEFAQGCADAQALGFDAWITLEREPNNPYDKNAVKVIGHWPKKGFFRRIVKSHHVGYLPIKYTEAAAPLLEAGRMKARLISVYFTDTGFVDINIIPVIPR
ncbi:MAG: hypothetical protein GC187_11930 [Alphaproteobacteria bacterium]|nr:hypothetical protein [Alphaproteobacteria bacterium]